jgi:DNA-binding transcriptional ArsR family regulator
MRKADACRIATVALGPTLDATEQYLIDLTIQLNKTGTMNSQERMSLDRTFNALGDPTRRAILVRLARGPATVGELAEPFAMSLPAISRHLKVLVEASLIHNERDGKRRRCQLRPEGLGSARDWLDFHHRFWSASLERLDAHLKTRRTEHNP